MATVFLADTLIDGRGREPLRRAGVVVTGDQISQIGTRDELRFDPRHDQVIDAGQATLIPGLIDSHCHIFSIAEGPLSAEGEWGPEHLIRLVMNGLAGARMWLRQGVTTVRDVAMPLDLDLGLRDWIARGGVAGPRIFGAGRPILMPGRPIGIGMGHAVNSADEARRAAREQLRAGADLIKLFASAGVGGAYGRMLGESGWEQLTFEEMQAATAEAHKAGRTVTAHAHHPESIKSAVRAGVDCIEHGHYADEEAIALMKQHGVTLVPTLAIARTLRDRGASFGFGPHMAVNARRAVDQGDLSLQMALAAGIHVAAGTDPVRGDTLARECHCLHEVGMSRMDVLVAATRAGAELLRIADQLGTLEVGKLADMVILDGNPLDDLRALERVQWVIKEGAVMRSPSDEHPMVDGA